MPKLHFKDRVRSHSDISIGDGAFECAFRNLAAVSRQPMLLHMLILLCKLSSNVSSTAAVMLCQEKQIGISTIQVLAS